VGGEIVPAHVLLQAGHHLAKSSLLVIQIRQMMSGLGICAVVPDVDMPK
jgi:hypothetical protein